MILDASVAAKWFLPDEGLVAEGQLVQAAMLQQRVRLSAPAVFWPEVAHAIISAVRRNRLDPEAALGIADRFAELQPLIDVTEVDPRDAIRTALTVGVGSYDAQYLSLGARLGSSVITADRRLVEQGRAHGYDIAWLGDISIEDGVLVDTPQGYS